jgi:hypothetical protein
MDTAVWVALIASVTSFVVAVASALLQQRAARKAREETRRSEAKVVLDRYRGPLLTAAWELGDRIDNIRRRGFLAYSAEGSDRESAAKLTTLFRFAQYFGWRELLRTEVQLLKFETGESTRRIADLFGDVSRVFATDKLDSGRAMVWLEEQRAIGELMIMELSVRENLLSCRGYAGFVDEYDTRFRHWMDGLAQDVLSSGARTYDRLRLLQWALFGLVVQLDEECVYDRDHPWLQRVRVEFNEPSVETSELESSIRSHLVTLSQSD